MNAKTEVAIVALTALFVVGCERAENSKDEVPIHAENVVTVSASEDDVTAATLARITSASVTLTNYLYRESDKAMALYQRIGNEILTLPPGKGEQCVKAVIRSILDVPYERLDLRYERPRSLRRMWDIMRDIGWPGIGEVDIWENRILMLYRIRDTIKYAQSETDNRYTRNFIEGETGYVESESEYLEQILAEWIASPRPPEKRWSFSNAGMTEEDCAIIKEKLETFLGRPIRTCDEIRRMSIERIQQQELEEERRRGGPDVQVDTDGL